MAVTGTDRPSPIRTLRSVLRLAPLSRGRTERRLRRCANIEDLRLLARRRLPGGVFDYIDGGAEAEDSLARNTEAFTQLRWRPRVLRDVSTIDTGARVLGRRLPVPLILSPTGFTRIADPAGELAVARAAAARSLPYTLSTLATRSIEDVAGAAPGGHHWFQLYMWRDRGLVRDLLARSEAAGYEAIVLTVDTAVLGRRERDVRRGFTLPPTIGLRTLVDGARHPGWASAFVRAEPIAFANLAGRTGLDGSSPVVLSDYIGQQFDPAMSWDDVAWLREATELPIVIKGVQSVGDAHEARRRGVDAVALSNHGGRQLDGGPSPLELVAPVRDAVGSSLEVYCDGGIRRGGDIVKACALGADAAMVGRAYLYGLGAGGERGVGHALDLLADGVGRTLALLGQPVLSQVGRDDLEALDVR